MKRRYRRYFIIMENEDTGFEVSNNQQPKGHARVEVSNDKGKMVLHCQNLKDLTEKRMRYRWYLVNTNKEEPTIVDIGPMEVDDNGKGEITWEFNGENVKATKEAIDEFNLLTLLVESIGENKSVVAPLVGYIDKEKFDWRGTVERKLFGNTNSSGFSQKPKKEKSFEKQQPKVAETIKKEEPIQKVEPIKPVETIQQAEPIKKETPIKKVEPVYQKEPIKKVEPIKSQPPIMNQEPPKKDEPVKVENKPAPPKEEKLVKETPPKEIKPQQLQTNPTMKKNNNPYGEQNILKSLQGYIETTVKMFPKVNPFEEPMDHYNWWHIYYNYQSMYRAHMPFIGYIDGVKYPTQYYPYHYPTDCQRQVYQYQHYLFGIVYDDKKEVKYYVYAIPGRKVKSEQPYGGKTGFDYWKPSRRGRVDERSQGYWLLHIDPKTGGVVRPYKPTIL